MVVIGGEVESGLGIDEDIDEAIKTEAAFFQQFQNCLNSLGSEAHEAALALANSRRLQDVKAIREIVDSDSDFQEIVEQVRAYLDSVVAEIM